MMGMVLLSLGLGACGWAIALIWDAYATAGQQADARQAATFRLMAGIPGILLVISSLVAVYGWQLFEVQATLQKLVK
jgi:hypothetical protein